MGYVYGIAYIFAFNVWYARGDPNGSNVYHAAAVRLMGAPCYVPGVCGRLEGAAGAAVALAAILSRHGR